MLARSYLALSRIEIISFIEDYAMQSVYIQPIFRFVLQTFRNAGRAATTNRKKKTRLTMVISFLFSGLDNSKISDDDEEDEELRLLSTEAILQWANKRDSLKASHPRSRFILEEKVREFIEWLRDEEDGDDDDDEDDDTNDEDD